MTGSNTTETVEATASDLRGGAPVTVVRVCAALLLVLLAALAIDLRPADAAASFSVAAGKDGKFTPAISGEVVVWQDDRNGDPDIYVKDLSSPALETRITANSADQTRPAISGRRVVWQDERNDNWDIYGYDLSTGQEFRVATGPGDQRNPAISGRRVVWETNNGGDWDIHGKDVPSGRVFRVATGPGDQRNPAISGQRVVWQYARTVGDSNIYLKNLKINRQSQLTTHSAWQGDPDISGTTVVWQDDRRPGNWDIHGYSLIEKRELRLTQSAADQWSPDVSGNFVVWADGRNASSDIYGKNLLTGYEFVVSAGSGPQDSPAFDGNTVVWEAQSSDASSFGDWEIQGSNLKLNSLDGTATYLRTSASKSRFGQTLDIHGVVRPAQTDTVVVTVKYRGVTMSQKAMPLDGSSRFRVLYKPPRKGIYQVTATLRSNPGQIGFLNTKTLRVW